MKAGQPNFIERTLKYVHLDQLLELKYLPD